jgi:hypothetical protein
LGARRLEVADVAGMEKIEDAVPEHNSAACVAMFAKDVVQALAREYLVPGIHAIT